jgi:hypothetical protein
MYDTFILQICLPLVGRITASFGSGMPTFIASIGSALVLPLIGKG